MNTYKIDWDSIPSSAKGVRIPCLGGRKFAEEVLEKMRDANELLPEQCSIEWSYGYHHLCFDRPAAFEVAI